jgi:hypothetical protein
VECKLRCVNFRRVSDPGRVFLPAFRVTGVSDDWYRSTMGVREIGLGKSQRAGEDFGSASDKRGSTDDKPRSTWQH